MSAFTDALTRLASFFNGTAYNASTNPGGLRGGGHRVNFIPALQDVATVGSGVASLATAVSADKDAAAASATAAAGSAAALGGTSATSVTIGDGSKGPFVTQSGKSFHNRWVTIASAANPSSNAMTGFASYSGTSLTIDVPDNGVLGSGTYADWVINVSAQPGAAGPVGATGAIGPVAASKWAFSNATADSDPGNGTFRFSSGTMSAASFIYIDNLNTASQDVTAWLDTLDDSTNAADRGRLRLFDPAGGAVFVEARVTGAVIDGTGYRKLPIVVVAASVATSGAPPFANGAAVAISFSSSGNKGADGLGAGDVIGPSVATGNGLALFDTTSGKLLKDAGAGIGTSGHNVPLLDGVNTWSGAQALAAKLDARQDLALSGDVTPTQIAADQNDYNPSGLSSASVLRLSSDAIRNITGLAGGADGRLLILRNVGSYPIVLKDASSSSTAANRFAFGGSNETLWPGNALVMQYDATLSRWVLLTPSSSEVVGPPRGNVTLITGTPFMNTDVVGATRVYWVGSSIPIWNGTRFIPTVFPECYQDLTDATKSPAAVAIESNYDCFGWVDSDGTKRVTRGPKWIGETGRGSGVGTTELELLNGIYVNKYAIANGPAARFGTYVGSIRSNGTATIDWRLGSAEVGGGRAELCVWNAYQQNQRRVIASVRDLVAWTYTSATVRFLNGSSTNLIRFLVGISENKSDAFLQVRVSVSGAAASAAVGIGYDSTTTMLSSASLQTQSAIVSTPCVCRASGIPLVGWNYYAALEKSDGINTATFLGNLDELFTAELWM